MKKVQKTTQRSKTYRITKKSKETNMKEKEEERLKALKEIEENLYKQGCKSICLSCTV